MNDSKKAEKYFKKSLSIFPEGDIALENLGTLYLDQNDIKDASIIYSIFTQNYPEQPKAYLGLPKQNIKTRSTKLRYITVF